MADVLEHLAKPEKLLEADPPGAHTRRLGHPRASPTSATGTRGLARRSGMFDYDQRGILDTTHLRFFTRRSIRKVVERNGFTIRRLEPVGLPLDALGLEGHDGPRGPPGRPLPC